MSVFLVLPLEARHVLILVSGFQVARELTGDLLAIFAQEGLGELERPHFMAVTICLGL